MGTSIINKQLIKPKINNIKFKLLIYSNRLSIFTAKMQFILTIIVNITLVIRPLIIINTK